MDYYYATITVQRLDRAQTSATRVKLQPLNLFTFRVQLHVDDVSHNRRVMERLHGHLGGFHVLKNNFGNSQVLFVLRIVQYLDLLDFPEFFAHVGKKSFPDVVVQPGECHLFWRHGADVALIDLQEEREALML